VSLFYRPLHCIWGKPLKKLPYRAKTTSGDIIDVKFNLHDETVNSVHVNNLITAILKSIDNEISLMGEVSNGDVLQAITMVLAIRAHIIHAPVETTSVLAKTLLNEALMALDEATTIQGPSGRA
jgi:hypothetical protein